MHTLAFIQNISPIQWGIILLLGLLFFGRRLPEMGKNVGKTIVEFKKGVKGIETEVKAAEQVAKEAEADAEKTAAAQAAQPAQLSSETPSTPAQSETAPAAEKTPEA